MATNTSLPRSLRRRLAVLTAALLLSAGGVLIAAPASAHDELVSTDPAADATLDALPEQLTLTFSGELATDPGATELQVADAGGISLADGPPIIEGTTVTQSLAGAASGVVTVLWKVVSSDGHPISGQFAFSVSTAPTPTVTPTPSESAAPADSPAPEPSDAPTVASADDGALPWIIGGLLLLALIVGALIYLLASRSAPRSAPPTER